MLISKDSVKGILIVAVYKLYLSLGTQCKPKKGLAAQQRLFLLKVEKIS